MKIPIKPLSNARGYLFRFPTLPQEKKCKSGAHNRERRSLFIFRIWKRIPFSSNPSRCGGRQLYTLAYFASVDKHINAEGGDCEHVAYYIAKVELKD